MARRKVKDKAEVAPVTEIPPENVPATQSKELVLEAALATLHQSEYNVLKAYIDGGRLELSLDTANRMFALYLNGTDIKEIFKLNSAIPYEAILWARFKYNWDREKELHIFQLKNAISEHVMKAQLDVTALMSNMLTAVSKTHGDKLKKYMQSGDIKDLDGALTIDSINSMLKIIDGLQKITGQGNTKTIRTENTQNLNVKVNGGASVGDEEPISSESSEKIMQILADEKRKKNAK